MSRAQDLGSISTRLHRIAKWSREAPERSFTSLAHLIDLAWLYEAYRRTRKSGAPGVDGQTAADYERDLEGNLRSLLDRFKSGRYHAPPVRGVEISKGAGRTRPIGIPTFEDKVLQRAVLMVLEAIYEQDFLDGSYGFRPGRSAHQALRALGDTLTSTGGGWVLEVDIQGFFETLDHRQLRAFLDRRVRDGVLRRSIHKWLQAGVLREGVWSHPTRGTPQGGVISPVLANVYLHEVLDRWFAEEVQPRLGGRASLVRYADDFVIVFDQERDARRVLAVLPKRLGRFGLTLHPDKTRLVRFLRPSARWRPERNRRPGTFCWLGFTHYWGRSRKGRWVVKRRTAKDRLNAALKRVNQWCRRHRHWSVAWQHARLVAMLHGHYEYYGITGNLRALGMYHEQVRRLWRKWLNRRSQRARMRWDRYDRLLQRHPLPRPRICHRATIA